MNTIRAIETGFVLDFRGDPSVEATVILDNGFEARASVPSGKSVGTHELVELRDGDSVEWSGRGVGRATQGIHHEIAPALKGREPSDLRAIDALLVTLDGTDNRSRLGTNALLAVSVACARAGAAIVNLPLWQYLSLGAPVLPVPMVNIFSGNLHALGTMSVQDVLVIPVGATDYPTALTWAAAIYRTTRQMLIAAESAPLVGDEGGFGWETLGSSEAAIEFVERAIEVAGLRPRVDVAIGLDVAATHLAVDGGYTVDGVVLTPTELAATYAKWLNRLPICSLEDPFDEDAWDDWSRLVAVSSETTQILGDDLIASQHSRLADAALKNAANAVLVKANQVGTITEALDLVRQAHSLGWRAVVSARSGETEDDWLADLAVGSGSGQIKVGSVARSERLSKYNRLLRIARSAGAPPYAGDGRSLPMPRVAPNHALTVTPRPTDVANRVG